MRHGKKLNHLKRKSAHRKAMLANMASSLIMHKRIKTTTAKAKALRTYIEPLITKAKTDNTHSRRVVFSYLKNKYAVSELFRDVAEKISDRPGGYTRILKTENRFGDNAEMCFIELVDYNENYTSPGKSKSKSTKSRRSRRGGKKKKTQEETAAEQTTESAEASVKTEEKSEEPSKDEQKKETPKSESNQTKEVKSTEEKTEEKEASKENKVAEEKKEAPQKKKEEDQKAQKEGKAEEKDAEKKNQKKEKDQEGKDKNEE